jgi:hypothetical protein
MITVLLVLLAVFLLAPDVPDGTDVHGDYEESQDGFYRIYRKFKGR